MGFTQIDATDTAYKVFSVRKFIPLHDETSITLLFPGGKLRVMRRPFLLPILQASNCGSTAWHRDALDVNAFQVSIPHDASVLEATFNTFLHSKAES
jgi:hypothetical protein